MNEGPTETGAKPTSPLDESITILLSILRENEDQRKRLAEDAEAIKRVLRIIGFSPHRLTPEAEVQWLHRDEALRLAGISERTLRRRATKNPNGEVGKIRRISQPVPKRKPELLYARNDIIALDPLRDEYAWTFPHRPSGKDSG